MLTRFHQKRNMLVDQITAAERLKEIKKRKNNDYSAIKCYINKKQDDLYGGIRSYIKFKEQGGF